MTRSLKVAFGGSRTVRRFLAASVAGTIAASLAGCSSGASASDEFVVANNFTPTGVVLPLYAAQALGYFKDEGLHVRIDALRSSQDALNALDTKRADLAVSSAILNIANAEKGLQSVSVGNSIGRHSYGLIVDRKAGVTNLKDLEGKTVLATAGFIIDEAKNVLEKQGVDVGKVTFATVAPAAILTTYVGGSGDAWLTSVPLGQAAVAKARPSDIFLLSEYGVSIPDYTYAVRPAALANDRDQAKIKKFLRAIYKAQVAAIADPEGVAEKVAASVPELDAQSAAAQWRSTMTFICSQTVPNGKTQAYQSPTDWAFASTFLAQIGFTKKEVDVSRMYTNDFEDTATATCPTSVGSADG